MLVRPKGPVESLALGYPIILTPADVLDDRHPHVKAQPGSFEPIRETIPLPGKVETATADPGVKRGR